MAGTSEKVDVQVVWAGGHRTTAQISRPVACLTQLSYYPQLAERARELADAGLTLAQIARPAQHRGLPPAQTLPGLHHQRGQRPAARGRHPAPPHPRPRSPPAPGPARMVAARPGRAPGHVRGHPRLLGPPRLGHRLPAPAIKLTVVRADPAEVERLRALHQMPRGQHIRRPWLKNQASRHQSPRGRSQRAMPTSRSYDSTAACSSRGRSGARTPASSRSTSAGAAAGREDHSQTGLGSRSPGR